MMIKPSYLAVSIGLILSCAATSASAASSNVDIEARLNALEQRLQQAEQRAKMQKPAPKLQKNKHKNSKLVPFKQKKNRSSCQTH